MSQLLSHHSKLSFLNYPAVRQKIRHQAPIDQEASHLEARHQHHLPLIAARGALLCH